MAFSGSSGTTVHIGPTTAAADAAAYALLAYEEIGEVETVGAFGDNAQIISFASLSDARMRKRKGVRDAGDLTITVADDPDDAGQQDVIAAEATDDAYAFKIVTNGSTFYFHALVMGARLNVGGANDVTKREIVLAIDTAIIEAAA